MLRVFHRYGDYQHKQRNRMKFMIKSLGWDALRAKVMEELDGIPACGRRGADARSIETAGGAGARLGSRPAPPALQRRGRDGRRRRCSGPGHHAGHRPAAAGDGYYVRWRADNVARRSRSATAT